MQHTFRHAELALKWNTHLSGSYRVTGVPWLWVTCSCSTSEWADAAGEAAVEAAAVSAVEVGQSFRLFEVLVDVAPCSFSSVGLGCASGTDKKLASRANKYTEAQYQQYWW